MKIWSDSFKDGEPIPWRCAFGKHHPENNVELCPNKNPHLAWSDVPEGTQSLVLVCHDPDVPSVADDVNKPGVTVPRDLPRADFFHWVLVDLKPSVTSIDEGAHSEGIVATGKDGPEGPAGTRHGLNNYTQWFEGDTEMEGSYYGYDGPCPPWNDELVHRYHFTLYALDVATCPVEGTFTGPDVLGAIEGHVLAEARITGTYKIYPDAT